MISYDLCCSSSHRFEGWFGSSSDYERQLTSGLVECPFCGNKQIEKLLSAPNIGRKGNQRSAPNDAGHSHRLESSSSAASRSASPPLPIEECGMSVLNSMSALPDIPAKLIEKIAEVQKKLLKDSQWVGKNFAEEARAIHYGETDARLIHGETTAQEANILSEEGINVAPLLLPFVPAAAKN